MPNKTIESAKNHAVFKKVLNSMIANRFYFELGIQNKEEINEEDLDKAIWLASIIAASPEENDKYLSSVFGIALFLEKSAKEYVKASYIILSRSGNLIASRFFNEIIYYNTKNGNISFSDFFGSIVDYELGSKIAINEIENGDDKIIGSDYQKYLWKTLTKSDENVAISAPTSAGKSFIIQNYIRKVFRDNKASFILYIVPTRALISQVSEDFKRTLQNDVNINTAFLENEDSTAEQFGQKELFILTPERTMKLMQYSYDYSFHPDIIFIDEIQNIEDDGNRGFLFEFLINEIESNWSQSRKIIAGPFLDKPNELLRLLFSEKSENLKTIFSPVFQLKITLKPSKKENHLLARIYFQQNLINEIEVPIEFNYSKEIKKSKLKSTVRVVLQFGKKSKNIIYFPKTNYVEQFTNYLTEEINSKKEEEINLGEGLSELIELVKEEVHPDYYLVDALKAKSAFHHGKLPEIIRTELEYLFAEGLLDNIVCTSTLMEGINLPAEKVFVPYPKKDINDLSPFEFGNIVGRAGRIRDSLIGTVICLERGEEDWAENYYENEPQKEIEPAINRILKYPLEDLIEAINQPLDKNDKKIEFGIIFLKNKYLKGENSLIEYLKDKDVNEKKIVEIVTNLSQRLDKINMPNDLLRLNPSIDPELQDKLYRRIKKEGINEWVLHKNENFNAKWTKEVINSKAHEETNFFGQLSNILYKLDEIFDFNAEAFFKHQISRTLPQMVFYAVLWMENKTFSELINRELKFQSDILKKIDRTDRKDINKTINEIIKVYSTIVSYVLVKYTKLLADILELVLTEEQLEEHKLTISLPTMLELGTYNSLILLLISKGMSRSIAIKIHKLIPENQHDSPLEWLALQRELDINNIYNKYLRRKGFLLTDQEDE